MFVILFEKSDKSSYISTISQFRDLAVDTVDQSLAVPANILLVSFLGDDLCRNNRIIVLHQFVEIMIALDGTFYRVLLDQFRDIYSCLVSMLKRL